MHFFVNWQAEYFCKTLIHFTRVFTSGAFPAVLCVPYCLFLLFRHFFLSITSYHDITCDEDHRAAAAAPPETIGRTEPCFLWFCSPCTHQTSNTTRPAMCKSCQPMSSFLSAVYCNKQHAPTHYCVQYYSTHYATTHCTSCTLIHTVMIVLDTRI